MKFSKILSNLIEQTLPDWRDQFLSYRDLKKQLKLIYPKETTNGGVRSNKRPRLSVDGAGWRRRGRRRRLEGDCRFSGEMVLLLNYSALNYTGLVKILKKYDKRSGALIRLPFIQKVLQQPFFTTDILNKLVKDWKEEHTKTLTNAEKGGSVQKVPEELAEIKYIESMYMKHTLTALEVLNKVRGGSSTVSMFSCLQCKGSAFISAAGKWKDLIIVLNGKP
ncbi:hypothetical protein C3L33_15884, partial [Rhododendron williamsianum]